ncbi:hypothetical protein BJ085DRAFT_41253 [Dimargaris cristalligena]|uniref:Uncharacterized protein n=1 Tax=Dimargaris cristalligena TaxID=215637 RepID=A0A4Q0A1X2_9FUNG|nr:hypothetical protein BJ085DRAFT_41253 [Dimargaris cristalligena]|eukprot:RKP39302.1 hypothetical protein BJ085DRAFT_41253 [Dimargaris cristalligena]
MTTTETRKQPFHKTVLRGADWHYFKLQLLTVNGDSTKLSEIDELDFKDAIDYVASNLFGSLQSVDVIDIMSFDPLDTTSIIRCPKSFANKLSGAISISNCVVTFQRNPIFLARIPRTKTMGFPYTDRCFQVWRSRRKGTTSAESSDDKESPELKRIEPIDNNSRIFDHRPRLEGSGHRTDYETDGGPSYGHGHGHHQPHPPPLSHAHTLVDHFESRRQCRHDHPSGSDCSRGCHRSPPPPWAGGGRRWDPSCTREVACHLLTRVMMEVSEEKGRFRLTMRWPPGCEPHRVSYQIDCRHFHVVAVTRSRGHLCEKDVLERTVRLPRGIDVNRATVCFRNGVLVADFPHWHHHHHPHPPPHRPWGCC